MGKYAPWTLAAREILSDGEEHTLDELAARLATVIPDRVAFDRMENQRRIATGNPQRTVPREREDLLHYGRKHIIRQVIYKARQTGRWPGLEIMKDEEGRLVYQIRQDAHATS